MYTTCTYVCTTCVLSVPCLLLLLFTLCGVTVLCVLCVLYMYQLCVLCVLCVLCSFHIHVYSSCVKSVLFCCNESPTLHCTSFESILPQLTAMCTPPCQNGGTCSSPGVCDCDTSRWKGSRCEQREYLCVSGIYMY